MYSAARSVVWQCGQSTFEKARILSNRTCGARAFGNFRVSHNLSHNLSHRTYRNVPEYTPRSRNPQQHALLAEFSKIVVTVLETKGGREIAALSFLTVSIRWISLGAALPGIEPAFSPNMDPYKELLVQTPVPPLPPMSEQWYSLRSRF